MKLGLQKKKDKSQFSFFPFQYSDQKKTLLKFNFFWALNLFALVLFHFVNAVVMYSCGSVILCSSHFQERLEVKFKGLVDSVRYKHFFS